ncbi:hypothetical protein FS749_014050 [Ceratobasidium sp. UAMH 11750]|nr:hypothetical protein FS749_014050 [Ceratobasidium sp. UAMH 11750]
MTVPPSSPVVLVTGCSQGGIGFALCEDFAAKGCTVYATARRLESMEAFTSPNIRRRVMDVTQDESVRKTVEAIAEEAGRIDIVVANAGVPCHGPILDIPIDQARNVFETNVLGMLRLAQAVFPYMAVRKCGTFITIGSIVGEFPTPWAGLYSSSKFAVHALTETLQMEARALSPDIHVMLVAPGGVKSNLPTNSKFQLPENSLFRHCLPAITARLQLSQTGNSMPTPKFAAQVVNAALSKNGAPRYMSIGANTMLFKFFKWLPRGLVLWLLWGRIGLGK